MKIRHRHFNRGMAGLCAFLLLLSLGFATAASRAEAAGNMEIEFAFAVHSVSVNRYIRHVGPVIAGDTLLADEIYVIYMTIHNNTGSTLHYNEAVLTVDTTAFTWKDLTVGSALSLYIHPVSMRSIRPGTHSCRMTLDGVTVYNSSFEMPRCWEEYMRLPSEAQLSSGVSGLRSPYISFFPRLESGGFTGYSIDVRTDHLPRGTYICPINWWMDLSSLESRYESVWSDYGSTGGGYCGLQVWDDGTRGVIMTLWDVFCRDYSGDVRQIKAKVLYPVDATDTEHNGTGEGSFVHYSYPFDWKAGTDYRFYLKQSTGSNGNILMTLWICDLDSGRWTKLFCFDTGLQDVWIRSAAGFLEDYITATAPQVRSMEFQNIRTLMRSDGAWHDVRHADFYVNGGASDLGYSGSYCFGGDERSCFIVTSGVTGLMDYAPLKGPFVIPCRADGIVYPSENETGYSSGSSSVTAPAVPPATAPVSTPVPTPKPTPVPTLMPTPDPAPGYSYYYSAREPPVEYDEFLRSGDWVLDLAWADFWYDDLLFWDSYWCASDVDGDGNTELIVVFDGYWLIYTFRYGRICLVSSGALARDMAVLVCPELGVVRFDGAHTSWSFTCYVQIDGDTETGRWEWEKEDPSYRGISPEEVNPRLAGRYTLLEQEPVAGLEPFA